MNSHTKRILIVAVLTLFFGLIVTTSFIHAQSPPTGGLVPCGNSGQASCTLCHLYELASRIINFLLYGLALPAAVIAFLIGGILMLVSRGNPKQLEMGKAALGNAFIGIIIAFAAWLLIATLVNTLGYKSFTPAWNAFPSCLPPLSAGPGAAPRERCDPATQDVVECRVGNEPGRRSCNTDGFFGPCLATCPGEALGETRACVIGGCPGTQTCANDPSVRAVVWGACIDTPGPECVPHIGTCSPVTNGSCSTANLTGTCFGSVAYQASQICGGESGGNPARESDVDRMADGRAFSIGLFQINLTVHGIGGLNCPSAFNGTNRSAVVINEALYLQCVSAAKDPSNNITAACQIYTARGNWADWRRTASSCNLL